MGRKLEMGYTPASMRFPTGICGLDPRGGPQGGKWVLVVYRGKGRGVWIWTPCLWNSGKHIFWVPRGGPWTDPHQTGWPNLPLSLFRFWRIFMCSKNCVQVGFYVFWESRWRKKIKSLRNPKTKTQRQRKRPKTIIFMFLGLLSIMSLFRFNWVFENLFLICFENFFKAD